MKTTQGRGASATSTQEKVSGFAANELGKTISTDPRGNTTTILTVIDRPNATITQTTSRTGINNSVAISRLGLLQSMSAPSVSIPAIFGYDGHGRQSTRTDPRTGLVTTTTYDPVFGQPATITGPDQTVSVTYFPLADARAGRVQSRTVNGQTTYFDYDALGNLKYTWGTGVYPLWYEYDGNGRLWKLHTYQTGTDAQWMGATWPAGMGDGSVTTWLYFNGTTQLERKTYQAIPPQSAKSTIYTYWPSGLLNTRLWARAGNVMTTYGYTAHGELKTITYNDNGGTPGVTFGNDANGRPTAITDAAGMHALSYDLLGQLESDAVTGTGILSGITLDPGYTATGRLGAIESLSVTVNGTAVLSHGFTYEPNTGRMRTVTDYNPIAPSEARTTATYDYFANSDWLWKTTRTAAGAVPLMQTRTPDNAGRLASIVTTRDTATVEAHTWHYDAVGRPDRDTIGDGTQWEYGYNARNEIASATRLLTPSSAALSGYSFGYVHDPIGNRTSTTTNGQLATYTSNALNQYSQRTVPSVIDVRGKADPAARTQVSVDNAHPATLAAMQSGFFHAQAPVTGIDTAPRYPELKVTSTKPGLAGPDYEQTKTGKHFLPATPEVFTHDEDGNLTSDGRWLYTWNAENQLTMMVTREEALAPFVPKQKLEFVYDYQGRRIQKTVSLWTGGTWVLQKTLKFVYDDGWNLLAELDAGNVVQRAYLWGLDLSDERNGAGGVGGLLSERETATDYWPFYDGNGNVTGLVSATLGTESARYAYGPFGEFARGTGIRATANPFRSATKYQDDETDLLYYGYRYYHDGLGRWLNRDPVEEIGGENLFGALANDPINRVDILGLTFVVVKEDVPVDDLNRTMKSAISVTWGTTYISRFEENGADDITLELLSVGGLGLQCAKVRNSRKIDVTVQSLVGLGNHYTGRGLADIRSHEQKRVDIYRLGYAAYLAVAQPPATKGVRSCGCDGAALVVRLEAYLIALRKAATEQFKSYALAEQTALGEVEGIDANHRYSWFKFDGLKKTYTVMPPPPFKPPLFPGLRL